MLDEYLNQPEFAFTVSEFGLAFGGVVLVYAFLEFFALQFRLKKAKFTEWRMVGIGLAFTGVVMAALTAVVGVFSVSVVSVYAFQFAPWHSDLSYLAWIYGFLMYELAYWLQHWAGHKVRILWCIHSPHHAPESMNMGVGLNHSFLETIFYFPVAFGAIPAMLGVHPIIIACVAIIDIFYGSFLHISDDVVKFKYGFLEKFMQTPSYSPCASRQEFKVYGYEL
jgi:sterol desaturase/sphingolipid hydroxylase (fatty acid hydroxylase superfamily)